jgi:hypothetical protein
MTASSRAWLAGVAAVFFSIAAHADPLPALPSEEQVNTARGLYREARELEKEGKLKEALEKALASYTTAATPVTALQVARLLAEMQRLIEARNTARSVALLPVSPRETDKGRDARQQASALADALDARIPKIAVGERPAGMDVLLDGKRLPTDAMAWQGVDPGAHALELRMGERLCTTLHVTLSESEQRTVDLHDAAGPCKPEVQENPVPAPAVPQLLSPPAPVVRDSGATHPWRPVAGVATGLGVAAFGVGTYLAISAKGDYDSVADQCKNGCLPPAYEKRVSARSRADAATAVSIAGIAAIGGGMLLWFGDPGHTRAQVALEPTSVRLIVPLH